jgi:hypothetical protein
MQLMENDLKRSALNSLSNSPALPLLETASGLDDRIGGGGESRQSLFATQDWVKEKGIEKRSLSFKSVILNVPSVDLILHYVPVF